jgi:hypothetical protein
MDIFKLKKAEATLNWKALGEWGTKTGHNFKKICWLCGEFSDPRQSVGHIAGNCQADGVCSWYGSQHMSMVFCKDFPKKDEDKICLHDDKR